MNQKRDQEGLAEKNKEDNSNLPLTEDKTTTTLVLPLWFNHFLTEGRKIEYLELARMPVPKYGQKWFLLVELGICGQFRELHSVRVSLQNPPFSNLQRCFRRLNGRCTSSIEGSKRAAKTCFLTLGETA